MEPSSFLGRCTVIIMLTTIANSSTREDCRLHVLIEKHLHVHGTRSMMGHRHSFPLMHHTKVHATEDVFCAHMCGEARRVCALVKEHLRSFTVMQHNGIHATEDIVCADGCRKARRVCTLIEEHLHIFAMVQHTRVQATEDVLRGTEHSEASWIVPIMIEHLDVLRPLQLRTHTFQDVLRVIEHSIARRIVALIEEHLHIFAVVGTNSHSTEYILRGVVYCETRWMAFLTIYNLHGVISIRALGDCKVSYQVIGISKNCIATWVQALAIEHLNIVMKPRWISSLINSRYELVGVERDCKAMCLFVTAARILMVDDVNASPGTLLLITCVHLRGHESSCQHNWQQLWEQAHVGLTGDFGRLLPDTQTA
mmetsp:Transcript_9030/g.20072  ORF Transcript_9030/g.20072 Transcript_9030/m.20072 type:complete len:367 (-) Transcript_9030:9-1109(-)